MKYLLAFASALPIVFAPSIAWSQTTPDPCDEQATCQAQKGAQLLAQGRVEEAAVALEKALHNFLKAKLHVETSDISKEKISEILQQKSVDISTINAFLEVLKDCDFARYTPTTSVMMKQEFEKAKEVITKIDKYL